MAAKPYSLSAVASLPPDDGQPSGDRDVSAVGSFTHKLEAEYKIPGAGTTVVSFGTIPSTGAKLVVVDYEVTSPSDAPITVVVNGSTPGIPISAGGGIVISSPNPSGAGITAMSLVATAAATVKVTLLA